MPLAVVARTRSVRVPSGTRMSSKSLQAPTLEAGGVNDTSAPEMVAPPPTSELTAFFSAVPLAMSAASFGRLLLGRCTRKDAIELGVQPATAIRGSALLMQTATWKVQAPSPL